jgi:hypothetical protein
MRLDDSSRSFVYYLINLPIKRHLPVIFPAEKLVRPDNHEREPVISDNEDA